MAAWSLSLSFYKGMILMSKTKRLRTIDGESLMSLPLPPLNFMVIHSFTVHFLLALYPLALPLRGDMDPQPRAFPRCFALLAAMAVPIWFFNRAFGTNFMFLMRAGEGNPLKLFERFGSHLLGYPVLLAVVFAVMYLLLRVLRRRTAVPAGK